MGTLLAKLWSGGSNKTAIEDKSPVPKSDIESDRVENEPSIQTESENLPPCTCAELEAQENLKPIIYTTVLETTVEVAREDEDTEVANIDSNVNDEDQGAFEIETNLWNPDVEDAITKIQAGIRGYLVRKQIRVLQQQTKDVLRDSDKPPELHEEEKYIESIPPPLPEICKLEQEHITRTRINGDDKSLDIPSQAADRLMDLKSNLEVSIDKDASDEHLILHPTATLSPSASLEMLPKNVIEDHLSASNVESYDIEVEAATKIQAAYRGYKLRKTISHEPSPAPSPTNEMQNFSETPNDEDEIGAGIVSIVQENIGSNDVHEKIEEMKDIDTQATSEKEKIVENIENSGNLIQSSVIPQENVENNFSFTHTSDLSSMPIEKSISPSSQVDKTGEKCETLEKQIKSEDLAAIPDICLIRNDDGQMSSHKEKISSSFAEPPVPRGSVDFDLLADVKPPSESKIVDEIESIIQNPGIGAPQMNLDDNLCLRPSKSRELDRKESADSDIMLLTDEFISKQASSNLTECPSPPDFRFSDPSQDLKLCDQIKPMMESISGLSSSQLIDIKDESFPSSSFIQPTMAASIQSSGSRSGDGGNNDDEMSAILKKAEHQAPHVPMLSQDPILNPSSLDAGDDSELIALASNNSGDELDSLSIAEPDFRPRSPNPFNGGKKRRRGKKAKTQMN